MVNSVGNLGSMFIDTYREFVATLPPFGQDFINLFSISVVIVIYSILVWKFYRFISKRNLIELDLRQYNLFTHKLMAKTISGLLYTLEYLIILPFMVFIWFSVFTIFLIILTTGLELNTLLIISTTVIVAIRMTAYYKEDLSKDIAKLLPLTLLGVSITEGGVFSFDRILEQVFAVPTFFAEILSYLLFIFIVEFLLRTIETLFITTGKRSTSGEFESS